MKNTNYETLLKEIVEDKPNQYLEDSNQNI